MFRTEIAELALVSIFVVSVKTPASVLPEMNMPLFSVIVTIGFPQATVMNAQLNQEPLEEAGQLVELEALEVEPIAEN